MGTTINQRGKSLLECYIVSLIVILIIVIPAIILGLLVFSASYADVLNLIKFSFVSALPLALVFWLT